MPVTPRAHKDSLNVLDNDIIAPPHEHATSGAKSSQRRADPTEQPVCIAIVPCGLMGNFLSRHRAPIISVPTILSPNFPRSCIVELEDAVMQLQKTVPIRHRGMSAHGEGRSWWQFIKVQWRRNRSNISDYVAEVLSNVAMQKQSAGGADGQLRSVDHYHHLLSSREREQNLLSVVIP